MKIVVLEKTVLGEDVSLEGLEQLGEVTFYGNTKYDQIGPRLKEADIAVINRSPMEEGTLKDVTNLKLVCVTGTGVNPIDQEYMKKRGIPVTNVRDYSTYSVCQHTFAMLFYVMEHLRYFDEYVKEGNYVEHKKQTYMSKKFSQLAGMTYGICGLGAIGKQVAKVAEAFGAKIIYYSTSGNNSCPDYERVSFDELLKRSDVISIHAPLTKQSKGLFNKEAFEKMKESAIIINAGRGAIIEEEALCYALKENKIAAAALDVLEKEPMPVDHPLLSLQDSNCLFITPHIAWASKEARQTVVDEVCMTIESFYQGKIRNLIWEQK